MLKVIRATRKSITQFQGPRFWKHGIWAKFRDQTWKNKNATLKNALIGSIFWNKNISRHGTFRGEYEQSAGFNLSRVCYQLNYFLFIIYFLRWELTLKKSGFGTDPEPLAVPVPVLELT